MNLSIDASTRQRAMAWVLGSIAARAPRPSALPVVDRQAVIDQAIEIVLPVIRKFEGLRLSPYLCSAGVPTIGYGATYYLDGRKVALTDKPITKSEAEVLLRHMVRYVYLPAVLKLCPAVNQPGQLAALTSFTFNLGAAKLKASTLRRRVNAGEWGKVPDEFRKWIFAGQSRLKGLERRREAEIALL